MLPHSILLDLPLSSQQYDKLYLGLIWLGVFTLLFIIVYLMIGEEREETEV
ncbi:MAG: hypothetical protein ACTSQI_10245 [Candidatus Helarchaeota archaeon]